MLGERAKRLKARYLHGKHGSICGGHKRERVSALPGEIWMFAGRPRCGIRLLWSRGPRMSVQKSAEVIVGASGAPKGRTREETGALNFDGGEEAG